LEEAGPVLDFFWDMPTKQLEDHFRNRQIYLALFGTKVLPKLVTQDSLFNNEYVKYVVDHSTVAAEALLPAAIDVELIWERIKAEAAKSEHKKQPQTKREPVPK
jgi:hypothetical protein